MLYRFIAIYNSIYSSRSSKAASCQLQSETRHSANTLFNVLCVTGLGSLPTLFLICLCVQPRFIEIYGSSGSVGVFVEGAALQEIYSILATIRRWVGTRCVLLTQAFKRITHMGSMVCFPIRKRLLRQAYTPHRGIRPKMASD